MLQRSLVKNVLCNSFVIFFGVNKKMSDNTGSSFFRTRGCYLKISRKSYGSGILSAKFVPSETLFQNLTECWINTHHNNRKIFWLLGVLMPKLEREIRRKWNNCLPDVEILLERIGDKDDSVNPLKLDENSEKYFQELLKWKEEKEEIYLPIRNFKFKRHEIVYWTAKPSRW